MRAASASGHCERIVALAMALSLLHPATAMSFCQQPNPPRVCAEFFAADAVFTGTVISAQYLQQGLPGHDPGWLYRLRVVKMYRGPAESIIEVYTENNSARFPLERGQTYLLFAYKANAHLEIYACGNSAKVAKADPALKLINEVVTRARSRSGGSIGGRIEPLSGSAGDLAGIRVTARSGAKTYDTLTRKDGSFDIRVPAGTYSLRTQSSTWEVSPYDLSFNRPDDIVIHDGGCADVIFRATPIGAPR